VTDLDRPALDEADDHHLRRVLRLVPGAPMTVADGEGRWRPATLASAGIDPAGDVVVVPAPDPPITVVFAPVKGDRPEWAVQKLTEAGVDRIALISTARSVVRWDGARADRHRSRLERVAREAAVQCRRSRLPQVQVLDGFASAAALPGACLAEPGGDPPSLDRPTVLIGPEGGWDPQEREVGLPLVGLAPHTLRAETAAVAAGVLLAALRAGLVGPAGR
jgi:16S rRNA (uracil1498-N3)-methyltransferase